MDKIIAIRFNWLDASLSFLEPFQNCRLLDSLRWWILIPPYASIPSWKNHVCLPQRWT